MKKNSDWHGLKIKDESIHVGKLPGRKSIVLYYMKGNTAYPLAYFRNEKCAKMALEFLDKLAEAHPFIK